MMSHFSIYKLCIEKIFDYFAAINVYFLQPLMIIRDSYNSFNPIAIRIAKTLESFGYFLMQ